MNDRSPFFAACCIAATALSLLLAGCNSRESRVQEALSDYQSASAAGDLQAARRALIQLVGAEDGNPEYWANLGRIQTQLGAFSDAYYAFSRAYELDRTNIEVLSTMTQLSLLSGNVDLAEQHARKLELLAPDHPSVKLTYGYVAMRRSNFDEAEKQADALLEAFPNESSAKLLKARVLLKRGMHKEAIALLEDQTQQVPDDGGAWKALVSLYEQDRNWPGVTLAASKLAALRPKDKAVALTAIDAAFRANDIEAARAASEPFLRPDAPGELVGDVLAIWSDRWNTPEGLQAVRGMANQASQAQLLAYATYFNTVNSPQDAAALLGGSPRLPVTVANMSLNAIFAESLALRGQYGEAKNLFDQILAMEPDHVYALRGLVNLKIRTGAAKAAITDAQRLVSVVPRSARDRLLLARAYEAAGDRRQVDRTLWDAFHEIPASLLLYEALRTHVQRTVGPEEVARVDAEFQEQQDVDLSRDFI